MLLGSCRFFICEKGPNSQAISSPTGMGGHRCREAQQLARGHTARRIMTGHQPSHAQRSPSSPTSGTSSSGPSQHGVQPSSSSVSGSPGLLPCRLSAWHRPQPRQAPPEELLTCALPTLPAQCWRPRWGPRGPACGWEGVLEKLLAGLQTALGSDAGRRGSLPWAWVRWRPPPGSGRPQLPRPGPWWQRSGSPPPPPAHS